jgi:diguanylate cyclase (GGDEF)-like protein
VVNAARSGRDPSAERTHRPLARRFTYRYAIAVAGFFALAVAGIFTFNGTLDRVDESNDQLGAVSDQVDRVQEIAALADRLSIAAINPEAVTPDEEAVLGKLRNDYFNELAEFRNVHLGLTEGTGSTGLDDPTGGLEDFWFDGGQSRVDEVTEFHEQADALSGHLGGMNPDFEAIVELNGYVQTTADPVDGSVAAAYDEAVVAYSDQLDKEIERQREINQALVALTVSMVIIAVFVVFRPLGQRIQLETTALLEAERDARENNERQLFRNQLVLGLERASSEEEIFGRVEAALREALPDRPAELLLADSTNAHLRQVQDHPDTGSPDCPVDDPSDCVAIARGVTVRFETSRALDVCPKLPQHAGAPCSAVCSPVRFLGQPLGVLHVIGPDLTPPEHQVLERINVIADETGDRLGTLRATRETRLQATTDGLTGLPNRRSLETAAEELISARRSFAIAMADLDHFKDLNDTYGHEAGDRALRLFARTLRANLRPDDTASRYGGEEFVLLLPDTSIAEARTALDRLRVTLAGDIAASGNVPFTASWGLTASETGETFGEMLQSADEALYAAKRAGRNRVSVAGSAMAPPAVHPPAPTETIVLAGDGTAETHTDTTTCGTCWFENPTTSSYCLRCGSPLTPAADAPADGGGVATDRPDPTTDPDA